MTSLLKMGGTHTFTHTHTPLWGHSPYSDRDLASFLFGRLNKFQERGLRVKRTRIECRQFWEIKTHTHTHLLTCTQTHTHTPTHSHKHPTLTYIVTHWHRHKPEGQRKAKMQRLNPVHVCLLPPPHSPLISAQSPPPPPPLAFFWL